MPLGTKQVAFLSSFHEIAASLLEFTAPPCPETAPRQTQRSVPNHQNSRALFLGQHKFMLTDRDKHMAFR